MGTATANSSIFRLVPFSKCWLRSHSVEQAEQTFNQTFAMVPGLNAALVSFQFSEDSERFVEHLLYWMTVLSECSLNRSKQQIGVFAVANKDGGAHRVFLITQKYPISPRLWAIREELEYILVTCDRLLNSNRSPRRLFAVANRKQNVCCVRWTEQASGLFLKCGAFFHALMLPQAKVGRHIVCLKVSGKILSLEMDWTSLITMVTTVFPSLRWLEDFRFFEELAPGDLRWS